MLKAISTHIKGIIWDWNGTLLDDTAFAVDIMNEMLERRKLPKLSVETYRQVFTFPVSRYYQRIGFDFDQEPFEIPASEFIAGYNSGINECQLHQTANSILGLFNSSGYRQFILSAMKQETLNECLNFYQIHHYFEHVSGLDDHYAHSKTENGFRLIKKVGLEKHELLLIGDTVHDFEVATELGCSCILVANGHQDNSILQKTGTLVLDNLSELLA